MAFFAFRGVNVGDFFLEFRDLFFERRQDRGQVGFALVGKGFRLFGKNLVGQVLKLDLHLLSGVIQNFETLIRATNLFLEFRIEAYLLPLQQGLLFL